MSTKFPEFWAELSRPFEPHEIKTFSDGKGHTFPYITARQVMARLDEVVGPENWHATYEGWSEHAVLCRLTLTLPDGQPITKCDLGSYTTMRERRANTDPGDDEKGGTSDALKRAAVQFGIGRELDVAESATSAPPPRTGGSARAERPEAAHSSPPAESGPQNGKELWRWIKDQELRHQVGLLKYIQGWAKLQEFPSRLVDYSPGEVAAAHAEAVRKLRSALAAAAS